MRNIALHIILLLLSCSSFAQDLNTHLSKPEINLGERVKITFSIQSNFPIDSVAYIEKRGVFAAKNSASGDVNSISSDYELEIMNPFSDTSYQENGKYIWKGVYELTAWDSAYVVIPSEQIIINDSLMYFPKALLQVAAPKADPSKPIYDINEEFTTVEDEKGILAFLKKNLLWVISVALILVVLIIVFYIKSKAKKNVRELSLREITLKEIDELEKSKSYEQNLKEYYFDLSIIVRRFFSTHFEERMLDKTSSEIELILSKKGLESSTIRVVNKILNQSDLVKFAKSEPPVSDVHVITNDARRVVVEIASLDMNHE